MVVLPPLKEDIRFVQQSHGLPLLCVLESRQEAAFDPFGSVSECPRVNSQERLPAKIGNALFSAVSLGWVGLEAVRS